MTEAAPYVIRRADFGQPRQDPPFIGELCPPTFPGAACVGRVDLNWAPDPRYEGSAAAIAVCRTCPHMLACGAYAIRNNLTGIWGGLTTAQRRRMRA